MLFPTAVCFMLFPYKYFEKIEEGESDFNLDIRPVTTMNNSTLNDENIITHLTERKSYSA